MRGWQENKTATIGIKKCNVIETRKNCRILFFWHYASANELYTGIRRGGVGFTLARFTWTDYNVVDFQSLASRPGGAWGRRVGRARISYSGPKCHSWSRAIVSTPMTSSTPPLSAEGIWGGTRMLVWWVRQSFIVTACIQEFITRKTITFIRFFSLY